MKWVTWTYSNIIHRYPLSGLIFSIQIEYPAIPAYRKFDIRSIPNQYSVGGDFQARPF